VKELSLSASSVKTMRRISLACIVMSCRPLHQQLKSPMAAAGQCLVHQSFDAVK